MKRFPKIKLKSYTVAYSEETQEYKAIANISLEGTLSQIINFEDCINIHMKRILDDNSEIDFVKEYIEKNKNRICKNCVHYLENIGYCEVLGKTDYINEYYSCLGWIERGDSNEQRQTF